MVLTPYLPKGGSKGASRGPSPLTKHFNSPPAKHFNFFYYWVVKCIVLRPGPGPGTGPGEGKNPLGNWPGKTRSTRRVDPGPGPPGQTRVRPGLFFFSLIDVKRCRFGLCFRGQNDEEQWSRIGHFNYRLQSNFKTTKNNET